MSEQTKPCHTPEARQFDFWLGEWDLTWGADGRGHNSVRAKWDGCVIEENFDGAPAMDFQGMSVSTYHPETQQWQQTWVDSQGSYIHLTGAFAEGKMVLINRPSTSDGSILFRMVFYNIQADSFDWDWDRTEDSGHTWENRWRIHYRRAGQTD